MNSKDLDLLCIGNALVDVFVEGGGQIFTRFGLDRPAQHIDIRKLSEIISTITDDPSTVICSGGGAANAAKISALLGARVCFTGAVGQDNSNCAAADKYGQLFEKELSAAGVELKLHHKNKPTGVCLYLQAGKETRIAASPSAALELSENDICAADIHRAKVVLIDGFMLGRTSLVQHILELSKQNNTTVAIDISSAENAREHAGEIMDYIKRFPVILFMNEAESFALYESIFSRRGKEIAIEPEVEDAELLLEKTLHDPEIRETKNNSKFSFFSSLTAGKSFPIVIIKLASRGALSIADGLTFHSETREIEPIDSTGAGDAFCAGFLTAWVNGKPIDECADAGNRAAGIVLGVIGTRVSVNDLNKSTPM